MFVGCTLPRIPNIPTNKYQQYRVSWQFSWLVFCCFSIPARIPFRIPKTHQFELQGHENSNFSSKDAKNAIKIQKDRFFLRGLIYQVALYPRSTSKTYRQDIPDSRVHFYFSSKKIQGAKSFGVASKKWGANGGAVPRALDLVSTGDSRSSNLAVDWRDPWCFLAVAAGDTSQGFLFWGMVWTWMLKLFM